MQPVEKIRPQEKNEHFSQSFLSRDLSRDIICIFFAG